MGQILHFDWLAYILDCKSITPIIRTWFAIDEQYQTGNKTSQAAAYQPIAGQQIPFLLL